MKDDPFHVQLVQLRMAYKMTLKECAQLLNMSPQYLCDLELGRRLPSVRVVHNICDYFIVGRGSVLARRHWHRAGARAHGWDL